MPLHPIQAKLLQLTLSHNLGSLSLRQIGDLIGQKHAQTVKYHLEQLEKGGYIAWNRESKSIIRAVQGENTESSLFSIPILGAANCGPADLYADSNIEGYLKISTRIVKPKNTLYALKAVGHSMNKANINGEALEDGDYALIDSQYQSPQTGHYVVSVIDGVSNIKKYFEDTTNHQIILQSESTENFPPIIIHPEETQYMVSGKVVQVIKNPKT